jgi:hypothetical protein
MNSKHFLDAAGAGNHETVLQYLDQEDADIVVIPNLNM